MLTIKVISAFAAMAMGAAVALLFPGVSPDADASTPAKVVSTPVKVASTSATAVEIAPVDVRPIGRNCSEQSWPYYEVSCLRDTRKAAGKANTVRMIALDHLATK